MKTNIRTLFVAVIIALMTYGCGGTDDDDNSCKNTVPVITDVVFYTPTGDDFNPPHKSVFNVGDEFDVIIYATDCDLDMYILYSDLGDYDLPDQIGVDRGYHFADYFVIADVPSGVYIVEFQIEDYAGHLSNIFPVTITVK